MTTVLLRRFAMAAAAEQQSGGGARAVLETRTVDAEQRKTFEERIMERTLQENQAEALRRFQEAQLASTTTVVAAAAAPTPVPLGKRKRGRQVVPHAAILEPPMPLRNDRTPGNEKKPNGVVFRAVYDCAETLIKTLTNLSKFYNYYPLVFTEKGLEILSMDADHSIVVSMKVPASAFVRYENLAQDAIEFIISSAAISNFPSARANQYSLTTMYDQYGNPDEVLHMMMYPRTEATRYDPILRSSFKPANAELEPLQPDEDYQYEVIIAPLVFAEQLGQITKSTSTVTMMLGDGAFEMGVITNLVDSSSTSTIIAVHDVHDVDKHDEILATKRAIINRLPDANPKFKMGAMRGFKFSAAYLKTTEQLARMSACTSLKLKLGVQDALDMQCGYAERPLSLEFGIRDGEQSAFSVRVWIVPCYSE